MLKIFAFTFIFVNKGEKIVAVSFFLIYDP